MGEIQVLIQYQSQAALNFISKIMTDINWLPEIAQHLRLVA